MKKLFAIVLVILSFGQSMAASAQIIGLDFSTISPDTPPDKRMELEFGFAIIRGDLPKIKSLIAAGLDVNKPIFGLSPLAAVARASENRPEILYTLLAAGADVKSANQGGSNEILSAFASASLDGSDTSCYECSHALIAAGADVNLLDASAIGRTDIVRERLKSRAKLDVRTDEVDSALILAASKGHHEALLALVNAGADVNAKDAEGYTPLHRAASEGNIDNVETLISHGSDVNAANIHGFTPLIQAAYFDHSDVASALIAAGADVNAKDNDGETPLIRAARMADAGMLYILISAGANVNAKDNNGVSVIKNVANQEVSRKITLLKSFGAY